MTNVDTPDGTRTRVPDSPGTGGALVPVALPVPARHPRPARRRLAPFLLSALALAATGGWYWWQHTRPTLPAGIVAGNGRLEADEIDVATKFPGRVAELLADEGDPVKAGQVVARMDTRDLEARLGRAEAAA